MSIEIESNNCDLIYLINEIRTSLSKESSQAKAWLYTLLSLYGDQIEVLVDLYRLLREENQIELLSFLIEFILKFHGNSLEKNRFLQNEFQFISKGSTNENDFSSFSYGKLSDLLSNSTKKFISSSLINQWSNEFEENLRLSIKSVESLNKARENAFSCISLSSESIPFVLQTVVKTEENFELTNKSTSLNTLRCLLVHDLLPLALENRSKWNVVPHQAHRWLILAIEFYLEYFLKSYETISQTNVHIEFEQNRQMFQCDQPIKQLNHLINAARQAPEIFNWQQFLTNEKSYNPSSNCRQQLFELDLILDRYSSHGSLRCPIECYVFIVTFPIFTQSIIKLSTIFNEEKWKSFVFLPTTKSIENRLKTLDQTGDIELIENFHLFVESMKYFQKASNNSLVKMFQEMLEKIQFEQSVTSYKTLLKLFYLFNVKENHREEKETIVIDDAPLSPTSHEENSTNFSPLIAPNLENFIEQFKEKSFESRVQSTLIQMIFLKTNPSANQRRTLLNLCFDLIKDLQENRHSFVDEPMKIIPIGRNLSLVSRFYSIYFDFIVDLIVENLPANFILLQHSSKIYPNELFYQFKASHLRYVFDRKLLSQLIKFIQTSRNESRRWSPVNSKRKLDENQTKFNDEQFIDKILQHVSVVLHWTDDQRRSAIGNYLIDEREHLMK